MRPFGSTLRQERERRGISLEGISSSTKIRLVYLQAIEQDHLDDLPGGIIGRGFVRAYARSIGVDDEEAVASYLANRTESECENQPVPPLTPKRAFRRPGLATRLPAWAFVAGFLAIGIGFVVLGELRNHYSSVHESTATSAVPANPLTVLSQTVEPMEQASGKSAANRKAVSGSLSLDREGRQENSSVPATTSEPDALSLVMNVRQDAWVSIIADGRRIMADTLVAPTERVVRAHTQIVVRAGNVGAIDFWFNGASLPKQGAYGEARTLRFDPKGLLPPVPKTDAPSPSTEAPPASPVVNENTHPTG